MLCVLVTMATVALSIWTPTTHSLTHPKEMSLREHPSEPMPTKYTDQSMTEKSRNAKQSMTEKAKNTDQSMTEKAKNTDQSMTEKADAMIVSHQKFPCEILPPSDPVPTSVNRLKPSDITVVAGLGDSYTAGAGSGGTALWNLLYDYPGLSWSMGGAESFRTFTSLPNILKEYRTDVKGMSLGINRANAGFNVAFGGAASKDMLDQARLLLTRMTTQLGPDFASQWKILTLFVGINDSLYWCLPGIDSTPEAFIRNVRETLDFLRVNFPRTFVNLASPPRVDLLYPVQPRPSCDIIKAVFFGCAVRRREDSRLATVRSLIELYTKDLEDLVASGRYDTSEDFTVVLQPLYKDLRLPRDPITNQVDVSYLTTDCFHLSRKGQALAARLLWKNMLEPVGRKSTAVDWENTSLLKCPTVESPYFFTRFNSPTINQTRDVHGPKRSFNSHTTNQTRNVHGSKRSLQSHTTSQTHNTYCVPRRNQTLDTITLTPRKSTSPRKEPTGQSESALSDMVTITWSIGMAVSFTCAALILALSVWKRTRTSQTGLSINSADSDSGDARSKTDILRI